MLQQRTHQPKSKLNVEESAELWRAVKKMIRMSPLMALMIIMKIVLRIHKEPIIKG
jgi:hypothetical protein